MRLYQFKISNKANNQNFAWYLLAKDLMQAFRYIAERLVPGDELEEATLVATEGDDLVVVGDDNAAL